MAQLAAQDYEKLFPERPRAKQMALKWLSEQRFADTISEKKPNEKDYEHIVRLIESLIKLKAILEPLYPEGSPFPANIFSSAQKWEKACKPKPREEKPLAAESQGQQVPLNNAREAQAAVRRAALLLIEQEPQKPLGYRLLLASRWELLEKAPPMQEGKTQLAGPVEQQRAYFTGLIARKEWKNALQKMPAAFTAGANHLWLDLQRIAAMACKELGETCTAIQDAILFETARLVKRVPGLTELNFADGSPCCDDATKTWVGSEINAVLSGGGNSRPHSSGTEQKNALTEERARVAELMSAGKIEDALDLLQNAIASSSNERENFQRSLLVSTILLKGKKPDVAVSMLETLSEKIGAFQLDRWDPQLSVEAWEVLFNAYQVAKVQKPQPIQMSLSEKQNSILNKISRIDPKKAFQLHK